MDRHKVDLVTDLFFHLSLSFCFSPAIFILLKWLSLSLLAFKMEFVSRLDTPVDPIASLKRMRVDDTTESSSPSPEPGNFADRKYVKRMRGWKCEWVYRYLRSRRFRTSRPHVWLPFLKFTFYRIGLQFIRTHSFHCKASSCRYCLLLRLLLCRAR